MADVVVVDAPVFSEPMTGQLGVVAACEIVHMFGIDMKMTLVPTLPLSLRGTRVSLSHPCPPASLECAW